MKHKDIYAQLERLNALMGTQFDINLANGGWALQTGRQERRRPAKEMYWTLDFAIDMIERLKRDHEAELADLRKEQDWDLDDDDEAFEERNLQRLRDEERTGIADGPDHVSYECEVCGRPLMRGDVCTDPEGNVYCPDCYRETED